MDLFKFPGVRGSFEQGFEQRHYELGQDVVFDNESFIRLFYFVEPELTLDQPRNVWIELFASVAFIAFEIFNFFIYIALAKSEYL